MLRLDPLQEADRERATQRREETMRVHIRRTVPLGELVLAAFDEAALCSTDPLEVSRLATQAVARMLRQSRRTSRPSIPPAT